MASAPGRQYRARMALGSDNAQLHGIAKLPVTQENCSHAGFGAKKLEASVSVPIRRRENLEYLCITHGSQVALAQAIAESGVTQPMISTILRKKRPLWPDEARAIEQELGIPNNWLDRYSLRAAAKHVRKFRELPEEARVLLNEMFAFAESQEKQK